MTPRKLHNKKPLPKPLLSAEMPVPTTSSYFAGKLEDNYTVHTNLGEKIVSISESKIRICLMNYLKNIRERDGWIAPFGIFITIFITLLTTDFKDKFHLSQYTWQAIFVICGIGSLVWLVLVLRKLPKEKTIDEIVGELIPSPEEKKPTKIKKPYF